MSRKPAIEAAAPRQLALILKRAHTQRRLRKLAPAPQWHVELTFLGPAKMKALNAAYRGKHYATDVLSFEAPKPFRKQGILGELVICKSVLRRQAREMNHSEVQELRVLITHGVLHLLGFDHEKGSKQAATMRRWEEKLLGKAGLIHRAAAGGT